MGKKLQELTNGFMSFAKAMPLLLGGIGGLFLPGGPARQSVIRDVQQGQWEWAGSDLIASYTFYDAYKSNKFTTSCGTGAKLMLGGVFVHKLLAWIDG